MLTIIVIASLGLNYYLVRSKVKEWKSKRAGVLKASKLSQALLRAMKRD